MHMMPCTSKKKKNFCTYCLWYNTQVESFTWLKLLFEYDQYDCSLSISTISFSSWVNIVSFYSYFGTFTPERGKVLLFSLGSLYGRFITELLKSIAYPTNDAGHVPLVLYIVVISLPIYPGHCKQDSYFFRRNEVSSTVSNPSWHDKRKSSGSSTHAGNYSRKGIV